MNQIIKEPIYNDDLTECLEIGYEWYDNQISIIPLPHTIKKVPKILPNKITSLENALFIIKMKILKELNIEIHQILLICILCFMKLIILIRTLVCEM